MSPELLPVLLIVCIYILVQLLFSLEILIPPVLFGFDWACFFFFFIALPLLILFSPFFHWRQ